MKYLQKGTNPEKRQDLEKLLLKMDEESIKNLSFDLKTFDICGWMRKHNISSIYGLDVEQWCNLRRTKIIDDMIISDQ